METSVFALYCGGVFIASLVQGISGFAFSMIALPLFLLFFSYTQSLALLNVLGLVITFYTSFLYRKDCEWRWIPLGTVASVAGDVLGILILRQVGEQPVWYPLLGLLFVALAAYLLWGQARVQLRVCKRNLILCAALAGFFTGICGVGGPIMAAFLLTATKSKMAYLSTMQIIWIGMMIVDVALRLSLGMMTVALGSLAFWGCVIMAAGLLLAKRLVRYMDPMLLRRIVCMVMMVTGVLLLVR